MRSIEEIKEEIKKVEAAHKAAISKQKRCEQRLDELNRELSGITGPDTGADV